jgi:CBS domain-containing protein
VALHDLKAHLAAEVRGVIALDVMRPPPPVLSPADRLLDALPTIVASDLRNIPVVDSRADMKLIGAVVRAEALGLVASAVDGTRKPGFDTPAGSGHG